MKFCALCWCGLEGKFIGEIESVCVCVIYV